MISRSLYLFLLSVSAFLRRLRYDLARELVVGFAALIIFATFFYVFNDFLNVEVKALSAKMRDAFAQVAAGFLLLAALWGSIRSINRERHEPWSFQRAALRLGEKPTNVWAFVILRCITVLAAYFGIAWAIVFKYLVPVSLQSAALIQLAMIVIILVFTAVRPTQARETLHIDESSASARRWLGQNAPKVNEMALWRLKQIFTRNRLTRLCLGSGILFLIFELVLIFRNAPLFALVFISLVAGIFSSFALAFQLQEDLNYAWAERTMGISHADFVNAYAKIGTLIGVSLGLIPAIGYLVYAAIGGGGINLETVSNALKLVAMTLTANLIMPYIMFQIDGRRPAIQIIMIILFALFVGTVIFANWLGVVALALVVYYGRDLQVGRFYRA